MRKKNFKFKKKQKTIIEIWKKEEKIKDKI